MFIATSLRRSPSTINLATSSRIVSIWDSVSEFTLVDSDIPVLLHIALDLVGPIPYIEVKEITKCLFSGIFIPTMRAISNLGIKKDACIFQI
jgi:hypothetical protein